MKHWVVWSLAMGLVGCGASSSSEGATEPEASPGADDGAPSTAGYVVHEWGLVDVAASGAVELAAGPGQPGAVLPGEGGPLIVRKPVLYVQLDPGVESLELAARVDVPGGAIVEHWPPGEVNGATLAWPRVEVSRCAQATRDLPEGSARESTRGLQRACDTPDGYCEVADLPGYVAEGSACLRVGSEEGTLLFYRASLPRPTLPFELTRSGGDVSARAAVDGVGELIRIARTPSGLRVARAPAPTAGGTVTLHPPTEPLDATRERAAMAEALGALGLTGPEGEAFLRAWATELFEPIPIPGRRSPPILQDVLLYWMPRAEVDRMAPLTFEPPPRELARAMLVRVEL